MVFFGLVYVFMRVMGAHGFLPTANNQCVVADKKRCVHLHAISTDSLFTVSLKLA